MIPKDKEVGKGKRSCVCIRNRMKNYISSTLAKKETFHFSTLQTNIIYQTNFISQILAKIFTLIKINEIAWFASAFLSLCNCTIIFI